MRKDILIVNEKSNEVTLGESLQINIKAKSMGQRPLALLTGIRSDSHSWNLVYIQLLLEERGFDVINLGANTPVESVQLHVLQRKPALVVVSTVNGHGAIEGIEIAQALKHQGSLIPMVIGGLLTTQPSELKRATEALIENGYSAVFSGNNAAADFSRYLEALAIRVEVSS